MSYIKELEDEDPIYTKEFVANNKSIRLDFYDKRNRLLVVYKNCRSKDRSVFVVWHRDVGAEAGDKVIIEKVEHNNIFEILTITAKYDKKRIEFFAKDVSLLRRPFLRFEPVQPLVESKIKTLHSC